jgi:hypothetical protein
MDPRSLTEPNALPLRIAQLLRADLGRGPQTNRGNLMIHWVMPKTDYFLKEGNK